MRSGEITWMEEVLAQESERHEDHWLKCLTGQYPLPRTKPVHNRVPSRLRRLRAIALYIFTLFRAAPTTQESGAPPRL